MNIERRYLPFNSENEYVCLCGESGDHDFTMHYCTLGDKRPEGMIIKRSKVDKFLRKISTSQLALPVKAKLCNEIQSILVAASALLVHRKIKEV